MTFAAGRQRTLARDIVTHMIDHDDIKLGRFDPVDYLTSEVAIEEYLIAAAEENDPAALESARHDVARARERLAKVRDPDEKGA